MEDDSFRHSTKCLERGTITGRHEYAHKPSRAFFRGNVFQFMQDSGIIRFIIRIGIRKMWLLGRIACGVHSRSAMQCVDLQPGVIGDDDLARNIAAVFLRFLAGVLCERLAVLDRERQRREVWDSGNLDSVHRCRAGEIA